MINSRAQSPTPEDAKDNGDADALAEMCAAIDKLCC